MTSCDVFFAKYAVFTINLLSALIGIVFFSIGTVFFVVNRHYDNFTTGELSSTPVILMIIGVIVLLVALFGMCGAIAQNGCMVLTFSNLLVVFLTLQLGVGIYGSIKQEHAMDAWEAVFEETLRKYEFHEESWDFMQSGLQCCGIKKPEDCGTYNLKLPDSCCQKIESGSCKIESAYKKGCKTALLDFFNTHFIVLASILLVTVTVQILLIGWSCFLYGVYSRDKDYASLSSNLESLY